MRTSRFRILVITTLYLRSFSFLRPIPILSRLHFRFRLTTLVWLSHPLGTSRLLSLHWLSDNRVWIRPCPDLYQALLVCNFMSHEFYDLCNFLHIVFFILFIFTHTGTYGMQKFVPYCIDRYHFRLAFFDFPLIVCCNLLRILDG